MLLDILVFYLLKLIFLHGECIRIPYLLIFFFSDGEYRFLLCIVLFVTLGLSRVLIFSSLSPTLCWRSKQECYDSRISIGLFFFYYGDWLLWFSRLHLRKIHKEKRFLLLCGDIRFFLETFSQRNL